MNNDKETLKSIEYMKSKGIPMPPKDSKCQICGKKKKILSWCSEKWVCKYLECSDEALKRFDEIKTGTRLNEAQI